MSFRKTFDLSVYFVLDPSLCDGRNYIDVAVDAMRGGATMLQLRDKSGQLDIIEHHANNLKQATLDLGVPLIINDYTEIAAKVDADGVHLGQEDMSPQEARSILGEDKIIGQTAFEPSHFAALDSAIVDYVGTGPVYPTLTKPNKKVLGIDGFSDLVDSSSVPVVGIGGIGADNASAVIEAGADGVAMIRSISEADNVFQTADEILNMVAAVRLREVL